MSTERPPIATPPRRGLGPMAADVFWPTRPDAGPNRRRLLHARRLVAAVATTVTLIQVIVWLMIALLGGGLDAPWWLWTAVPSLVVVAALTCAERRLQAESDDR